MIKACPLIGECREECYAYQVAKNTIGDSFLNVETVLRDFTNIPNEFNDKIGQDYHEDRISGNSTGEACYQANANLGCTEVFKVAGTSCTGQWTYQCDYDKNRLPLYLWRALCNETTSDTVYYTVPVLKRNDSCNPQPRWQLVMEKVPVGCTCKH